MDIESDTKMVIENEFEPIEINKQSTSEISDSIENNNTVNKPWTSNNKNQ